MPLKFLESIILIISFLDLGASNSFYQVKTCTNPLTLEKNGENYPFFIYINNNFI